MELRDFFFVDFFSLVIFDSLTKQFGRLSCRNGGARFLEKPFLCGPTDAVGSLHERHF
jgi:hypothetical protein